MSDYIQQIFDRTDLQVLRGLLIDGIGDQDAIDQRSYQQRLDESSAPMQQYLSSTCPDEEKRDAAFGDISQALTAHQDVYFEIGLKCGARLLYQLLCER